MSAATGQGERGAQAGDDEPSRAPTSEARGMPARAAGSMPPNGFWLAFLLGMGLRVGLAVATRGSDDANIWTEHAAGVAEEGLLAHYQNDPDMNHPPVMACAMAVLYRLAVSLGVEFRDLFRLLFAGVDGLNVFLLVRVLDGCSWKWRAAGLYAVSPVAVLLGAMHGNTDVLVATSLLVTCLVAGRGSVFWTGVCIGLGAWIKLPALLAAPIFGFAFARWRDRWRCAGVAVVVAAASYAPMLALDAALVASRIFAYKGKLISTLGDPPTWIWGFKSWIVRVYGPRAREWPAGLVWYCRNSHLVALPAMIALAFLRRRERDARGLAVSVAGCYAVFYGFVETWTFQYLAWAMPFWMAVDLRFAIAANLLAGGYLYGLYAYLTEDGLLRGEWRFLAHPDWPAGVVLLRDLAHGFFAATAIVFLVRALWRARARARIAGAGAR